MRDAAGASAVEPAPPSPTTAVVAEVPELPPPVLEPHQRRRSRRALFRGRERRARAAAAARRTTCGSASSRATRCPTSTVRWSRNGSSGTRRGPTTSRAWSIAAAATSTTSSPRSRSAACRLEIALLPMIESAYNPNAMSIARASGIWQFMPSTGKHYGLDAELLVRLAARRARRDRQGARLPAPSCTATSTTGSWRSPATTGAKATSGAAIARNKAKGLPTDYESLAMPAETRNYLPKLQAVKNIVRDPEKYGARARRHPRRAVLHRRQDRRARWTPSAPPRSPSCRSRSSCALNPQHNRPVIAGADEHVDPAADRQRRDLRRQARS